MEIRCIETGEIFKNGVSAASFYNVSPAAITQAIKRGTAVKGFHLRKHNVNMFTVKAEQLWCEVYEECFQKWYSGEQKIDDAMVIRLSAYRFTNTEKSFKKSTISSMFRRECLKRNIPTPKRSRLNESHNTKRHQAHDLYTWENAYDKWVMHDGTLKDIADELGVSTKTVYRHFKQLKGD